MSLGEKNNIHSSSFRDPSGFLYKNNGTFLRQVNKIYKKHYDQFMQSGLYQQLTKLQLLIEHKEISLKEKLNESACKILKPKTIPFVSYPYEWSFSMLKDAALLTLQIQKVSIEHGMSLKDASAYNIQFMRGRPVLIDTLSFEKYEEGKPWVAYRQFCQHFLAPLALAAYRDIRLAQLLRVYIDGIPLDLVASLLPKRALLNTGLLSHLYLHAKAQRKYSVVAHLGLPKSRKLNRQQLMLIIDSLQSTIKKLSWKKSGTEWGDYYEHTNYSKQAFEHKKKLVDKYIQQLKPRTVWDLGANTGEFSRLASDNDIFTIAFDIDPLAVEKNYRETKAKKEKNILPLLMDFTNPSPSLGWAHSERDSLITRGPANTALALALIHHLAISNNLPFAYIAEFFARICKSLIIEFVPKTDSQVQKLLSTREDIFDKYTQEHFEKEFGNYYKISNKHKIVDSERAIYLMIRL